MLVNICLMDTRSEEMKIFDGSPYLHRRPREGSKDLVHNSTRDSAKPAMSRAEKTIRLPVVRRRLAAVCVRIEIYARQWLPQRCAGVDIELIP